MTIISSLFHVFNSVNQNLSVCFGKVSWLNLNQDENYLYYLDKIFFKKNELEGSHLLISIFIKTPVVTEIVQY